MHSEERGVLSYVIGCFFFFQAEDGIRDLYVTGVQTCALPISSASRPENASAPRRRPGAERTSRPLVVEASYQACPWATLRMARNSSSGSAVRRSVAIAPCVTRSEERRVGKECRAQCATDRREG